MSLPKVSRLIVGIGFLAACTRTEAPPKANIPERVATAPASAEALRAPARSAVHVADASASRRSLANANRSIAAIVREMRGPKKVGKSTERADVAFSPSRSPPVKRW